MLSNVVDHNIAIKIVLVFKSTSTRWHSFRFDQIESTDPWIHGWSAKKELVNRGYAKWLAEKLHEIPIQIQVISWVIGKQLADELDYRDGWNELNECMMGRNLELNRGKHVEDFP